MSKPITFISLLIIIICLSLLCPPILSFQFFSASTSQKFPSVSSTLFSVITPHLHIPPQFHTKTFKSLMLNALPKRSRKSFFRLNVSLSMAIRVVTSQLHFKLLYLLNIRKTFFYKDSSNFSKKFQDFNKRFYGFNRC